MGVLNQKEPLLNGASTNNFAKQEAIETQST